MMITKIYVEAEEVGPSLFLVTCAATAFAAQVYALSPEEAIWRCAVGLALSTLGSPAV